MVPKILDVLKDQAKATRRQETVFKIKPRETLFPGCP
jgi:hypothetical protein